MSRSTSGMLITGGSTTSVFLGVSECSDPSGGSIFCLRRVPPVLVPPCLPLAFAVLAALAVLGLPLFLG